MKNTKIYKDNIKKQIGAVVLSVSLGVASFGLTGCAKTDDKKNIQDITTSQVVYSVEKSEYEKKLDKELRIITNTTVSNHMDIVDEDTASYDKYIDIEDMVNRTWKTQELVYTVRQGKFKSGNFLEEITNNDVYGPALFKYNSLIVVPNDYQWIGKLFGEGFHESYADAELNLRELKGIYNNHYLLYEYKVTAKKDMSVPYMSEEDIQKYGEQKPLYEGDYIFHQALYIVQDGELKLLANKQTGIGADNDNVKNGVLNNFDEIINNIDELAYAKESQSFVNSYELQNYISEQEYNYLSQNKR